MVFLMTQEAKPQGKAQVQTQDTEIIIHAGQEFNTRHPWVVEQIKVLATKAIEGQMDCSWLYGRTVVVANTVDYDLPMHVVHIGDKRLAIVDDPSEEMLLKLIDKGYDAMALATRGRLSPDGRTKKYPDKDCNNIEEALISLVDNDDAPFIDPDFQGQ